MVVSVYRLVGVGGNGRDGMALWRAIGRNEAMGAGAGLLVEGFEAAEIKNQFRGFSLVAPVAGVPDLWRKLPSHPVITSFGCHCLSASLRIVIIPLMTLFRSSLRQLSTMSTSLPTASSPFTRAVVSSMRKMYVLISFRKLISTTDCCPDIQSHWPIRALTIQAVSP